MWAGRQNFKETDIMGSYHVGVNKDTIAKLKQRIQLKGWVNNPITSWNSLSTLFTQNNANPLAGTGGSIRNMASVAGTQLPFATDELVVPNSFYPYTINLPNSDPLSVGYTLDQIDRDQSAEALQEKYSLKASRGLTANMGDVPAGVGVSGVRKPFQPGYSHPPANVSDAKSSTDGPAPAPSGRNPSPVDFYNTEPSPFDTMSGNNSGQAIVLDGDRVETDQNNPNAYNMHHNNLVGGGIRAYGNSFLLGQQNQYYQSSSSGNFSLRPSNGYLGASNNEMNQGSVLNPRVLPSIIGSGAPPSSSAAPQAVPTIQTINASVGIAQNGNELGAQVRPGTGPFTTKIGEGNLPVLHHSGNSFIPLQVEPPTRDPMVPQAGNILFNKNPPNINSKKLEEIAGTSTPPIRHAKRSGETIDPEAKRYERIPYDQEYHRYWDKNREAHILKKAEERKLRMEMERKRERAEIQKALSTSANQQHKYLLNKNYVPSSSLPAVSSREAKNNTIPEGAAVRQSNRAPSQMLSNNGAATAISSTARITIPTIEGSHRVAVPSDYDPGPLSSNLDYAEPPPASSYVEDPGFGPSQTTLPNLPSQSKMENMLVGAHATSKSSVEPPLGKTYEMESRLRTQKKVKSWRDPFSSKVEKVKFKLKSREGAFLTKSRDPFSSKRREAPFSSKRTEEKAKTQTKSYQDRYKKEILEKTKKWKKKS
jgi:hypothetical protein